jgi:hypothetical protein
LALNFRKSEKKLIFERGKLPDRLGRQRQGILRIATLSLIRFARVGIVSIARRFFKYF